MRSRALFMRRDPAYPDLNFTIRLAVFRSVPSVDPMHPGVSWTLVPSRSAGTPTELSGTTHGRQSVNHLLKLDNEKSG
jgi:hypothetical protein